MEDIKITDYISPEFINLDLKSKNKNALIKELFDIIKSEKINNPEQALKDIYEREEFGTTGIGKEVAIPHAKTDSVEDLIIGFGLSKTGIDYDSIDGKDAHIFFMFLSPKNQAEKYLKILARISRLIKEKDFREKLLSVKTPESVINIIKQAENK